VEVTELDDVVVEGFALGVMTRPVEPLTS